MDSNSVCNHISDYKIGRQHSGSLICLMTEVDDTKFCSKVPIILIITLTKFVIYQGWHSLEKSLNSIFP